jgi:hypothetical protein
MPNKKKELISYLKENGPTKVRSLRNITNEPPRRFSGIKELKINPGRSTGDSKSASGTTLRIGYLEDEHSKRQVLEAWADYHVDMIDRVPTDAIYRATPIEFRDEIKKIIDVDSYYSDRGGDNSENRKSNCPICGDDLDGKLPTHLEKECDG